MRAACKEHDYILRRWHASRAEGTRFGFYSGNVRLGSRSLTDETGAHDASAPSPEEPSDPFNSKIRFRDEFRGLKQAYLKTRHVRLPRLTPIVQRKEAVWRSLRIRRTTARFEAAIFRHGVWFPRILIDKIGNFGIDKFVRRSKSRWIFIGVWKYLLFDFWI